MQEQIEAGKELAAQQNIITKAFGLSKEETMRLTDEQRSHLETVGEVINAYQEEEDSLASLSNTRRNTNR